MTEIFLHPEKLAETHQLVTYASGKKCNTDNTTNCTAANNIFNFRKKKCHENLLFWFSRLGHGEDGEVLCDGTELKVVGQSNT